MVGSKRAMAELGRHGADHLPRDRGDHRHHAARQRDRRGADRARAAGHRPDRAELRHRPGRDERAPALPVAARPDPAVGDAERRPAGADRRRGVLPADARRSWPTPWSGSSTSTASGWSAAAAAPRRSTSGRWPSGCTARRPAARRAAGTRPASPRSTTRCRSPRTPRADGGGADQRQRLQGVPRGDARRRLAGLRGDRPRARPATARTCWTCASTTSAATAPPTCGSWPAGSPPPPRCRSCWTPPSRPVIEAGLEMLGGRCVVNSVNFEDGDGPDSRYARVMPIVARARRGRGGADHRRGGPGPYRASGRSGSRPG